MGINYLWEVCPHEKTKDCETRGHSGEFCIAPPPTGPGQKLIMNFGKEDEKNGVYELQGWKLREEILEDTDSWYDIWEPSLSSHNQGTSFDFSCSMELDKKAFDEAKKIMEESFGEPEQLVLSPQDYAAISLEHRIQQLVKALEAGNYNVPPGKLTQGAGLYIEDLSPVMRNVVYDNSHIKLYKSDIEKLYRSDIVIPCACCKAPEVNASPGIGDVPIPVTDGWNEMSLPGAKRETASPEEIDRFSEHQKPYNHPTYGSDLDRISRADHKHDIDFNFDLEETPKDYPRMEDAPLVNGRSSKLNCYMCGKYTEHMYARSVNDKFPCHINCANDLNKVDE